MTDLLETQLREVFAQRAAEVPADAVERLHRIDYRPHTKRHWPLAMSALGAASGTAAVVSVVVLGGSETAFAGWSATPATLTADAAPATPASCQAQLPTALGSGTWTQVANDVRGPYTMTVYESGTSLASCFAGPSFTTMQAETFDASQTRSMVSASGSGDASAPHPPSAFASSIRLSAGGGIEQMLVSHFSQAGDGPYSLVEGRLDSGVSAVTLVLSDGQDVTATTGSGWLVAWWPGDEDVTSAQITTTSGTTTVTLHSVKPPTPYGGAGAAPVQVSPGDMSPTGNS